MKFTREQYIELLTFGQVERQMFSELMGPLIGLGEEWRAQGATEDDISMIGFDWDYVDYMNCGGNTGPIITHEPRTIEENEEYIIQRDYLGRTIKLCKLTATVPLPLDFPVKQMADWLKLKPLFEFSEDRIDWRTLDAAKQAQGQGTFITSNIPGGWDIARELMGEEVACVAYYTQPEMMRDILETITDTAVKVLELVTEELTIDELCIHEDLAGKSGPLIGPKQFNEFIKPYYRKVWDLLSLRGTKIFDVDSDGNINPLIDSFLDSGVNMLHPMEPAAGMDIVEIRKKYGKRLAMAGGIDKHVLRKGKEDIRKELEYKLQPLMQQGGMIFGLDHRIPNGTPLDNYRYYVKLGREILGLPPLSPSQKGWKYMAH